MDHCTETSVVCPTMHMKNIINSVIDGHIKVKFCTGTAHDKTILHAKQASQICTEVIENDVLLLKFEHFRRKHSTLKGRISVVCELRITKNCCSTEKTRGRFGVRPPVRLGLKRSP